MYKGTSKFWQRARDTGVRASDWKRKKIKTGKPRSRIAAKLDRAAEEGNLQNWVAYIRHCRECNVAPQVPDDILAKLRMRKLVD